MDQEILTKHKLNQIIVHIARAFPGYNGVTEFDESQTSVDSYIEQIDLLVRYLIFDLEATKREVGGGETIG